MSPGSMLVNGTSQPLAIVVQDIHNGPLIDLHYFMELVAELRERAEEMAIEVDVTQKEIPFIAQHRAAAYFSVADVAASMRDEYKEGSRLQELEDCPFGRGMSDAHSEIRAAPLWSLLPLPPESENWMENTLFEAA